jgi:hypothetical protein
MALVAVAPLLACIRHGWGKSSVASHTSRLGQPAPPGVVENSVIADRLTGAAGAGEAFPSRYPCHR